MPKELEEPLNGDGFGIGWYVADVNYEPVTFVSINPCMEQPKFTEPGA
jgi:predicted glutamine amidotransferase